MPTHKSDSEKIAFITSSLTAGGAQGNIINIAKYLSRRSIHVDIILLKGINDYEKDKLKTISLTKFKGHIPFLILPFVTIFLTFKMYYIAKKGKHSLLVGSHEYYPYYLTVLCSKLLGIKSMLLVGNDIQRDIKQKSLAGRLHLLLIKGSFLYSDKLVSASKSLAESIKKNFHVPLEKIVTIYNGIDVDEVKKLSRSKVHNVAYGQDYIISIGRLIEKKGYQNLIRAFKLVHEKHGNIRLIIIGTGMLKTKLEKLARDLGVSQNVTFLGFVKNNPYKYLRRSKFFVFSSLYEGFGNTIIEAMACGLPIISTDCKYGPREILDDNPIYDKSVRKPLRGKYGILVPSLPILQPNEYSTHPILREEKMLAQTIIDLIKSGSLQTHYSGMSRKRVHDFKTNKMGELHYRLFKEVLNTQYNHG